MRQPKLSGERQNGDLMLKAETFHGYGDVREANGKEMRKSFFFLPARLLACFALVGKKVAVGTRRKKIAMLSINIVMFGCFRLFYCLARLLLLFLICFEKENVLMSVRGKEGDRERGKFVRFYN